MQVRGALVSRKLVVATALLSLLSLVACSRGGLSRHFRPAAEEALSKLRAAGEARSTQAVEQADAAVTAARGKADNSSDLKTADVLDWYSILVHRHDVKRTENWRKLCDTETQLYLDGKHDGSTEVWSGGSGDGSVTVTHGACAQAVFQMMKQDCEQLVATRGFKPSDCELLQSTAVVAK